MTYKARCCRRDPSTPLVDDRGKYPPSASLPPAPDKVSWARQRLHQASRAHTPRRGRCRRVNSGAPGAPHRAAYVASAGCSTGYTHLQLSHAMAVAAVRCQRQLERSCKVALPLRTWREPALLQAASRQRGRLLLCTHKSATFEGPPQLASETTIRNCRCAGGLQVRVRHVLQPPKAPHQARGGVPGPPLAGTPSGQGRKRARDSPSGPGARPCCSPASWSRAHVVSHLACWRRGAHDAPVEPAAYSQPRLPSGGRLRHDTRQARWDTAHWTRRQASRASPSLLRAATGRLRWSCKAGIFPATKCPARRLNDAFSGVPFSPGTLAHSRNP